MPANKEFLYHYLDDYQDELKNLAETIAIKTTCENLKMLNDIYVERCVYMNPITKSYVVPVIVPFISNDGKKLFLILKIDLLKYINIFSCNCRIFANTCCICILYFFIRT